MNHWSENLPADACTEARLWCETQPSMTAAWATCARGDWMLWLLGRVGADRKLLVLAACACARLSLHHVPQGEDRPRLAIETAEKWTRGEATLDEVRDAADAARVVAYAAADAAYAAAAAADAAADAAAAAYAAAYTAAVRDAPTARAKALADCADIVREYFPNAPRLAKKGG